MNREKVIRQFGELLSRLYAQAELAGHQTCREKRFDPQLFSDSGHRLQDYLQQISDNLEKLRLMPSAQSAGFHWLSQRILDQSLAMQRELSSLETRQPAQATAASDWLSRYQQHLGYESRLCQMIHQQEQRLNNAETLVQQQEIAEQIKVLEQRLARCRIALQESHWQASLRNSASAG